MRTLQRATNSIRSFFLPDIQSEDMIPLRQYLIDENMIRIRMVIPTIIVVQLLLTAYYGFFTMVKASYLLSVALFLCTAIGCWVVLGRAQRDGVSPSHQIAAIHIVLLLFLLFDVHIQYEEALLSSASFRFFVGMLALLSIPLLTQRQSLAYITAMFLASAAYFFLRGAALEPGILLYRFLYTVCALCVASIRYVNAVRCFLADREKRSAIQELANANQELCRLNEELSMLSTTDPLTHICNRRAFDQYYPTAWNQCQRARDPIALLMLDIDYFKPYNDYFGHQSGDQCLQTVAAHINRHARRSTDMIARYGGEEFIVLLPGASMADAIRIAQTIRQDVEALQIEAPPSVSRPHVTVSIGVACQIPSAHSSHGALVQAADAAMYRAKANGKNCVMVEYADTGEAAFAPSLSPSSPQALLEDLRSREPASGGFTMGHVVLDLEALCVDFSPDILDSIDLKSTHLDGLDAFVAYVAADDETSIYDMLSNPLRYTDEGRPLIFRYRHRNGHYRWAILLLRHWETHGNEISRLIGTLYDATIFMQEAELYRVMADGAADYLFYYDYGADTNWFNSKFREAFQLNEDDGLEQYLQAIHPEDIERYYNAFRYPKEGYLDVSLRLRKPDGEYASMRIRARIVSSAGESGCIAAGAIFPM